MNEREILIADISGSFESMRVVEAIEAEFILTLSKRAKARGVGRFILFYLVGAALGGLIMMMFANSQAAGSLIGFALFILPILLPIVMRIMSTKTYDKKLNKLNEELVTAKNNPSLCWLPMAYRDSFSFKNIATYVQNMRANTLQEAINLLETEKHQARLEENAKYATKFSIF